MPKSYVLVILLVVGGLLVWSVPGDSKPLPRAPRKNSGQDLALVHKAKAEALFEYAKRENRRLRWDGCLARKALVRARKMVQEEYFSHQDPKTGKNPAWKYVTACYRCRYAGENLAMGYETAKTLHDALMESPTHRKNIVDPRFSLMGVGCYDYICVQLFAGF